MWILDEISLEDSQCFSILTERLVLSHIISETKILLNGKWLTNVVHPFSATYPSPDLLLDTYWISPDILLPSHILQLLLRRSQARWNMLSLQLVLDLFPVNSA